VLVRGIEPEVRRVLVPGDEASSPGSLIHIVRW
jgi:hypothetical protein